MNQKYYKNKNKYMTTSEMIDISIANERTLNVGGIRTDAMRIVTNLSNACSVFSDKSFKDIRKLHKKAKTRGVSAEYKGIKILTWCGMGRIVVTVKNMADDSTITLVGGESDKDSMAGFHGIDCEPNVALDMLELLTRNWFAIYDDRYEEKITTLFTEDRSLSFV